MMSLTHPLPAGRKRKHSHVRFRQFRTYKRFTLARFSFEPLDRFKLAGSPLRLLLAELKRRIAGVFFRRASSQGLERLSRQGIFLSVSELLRPLLPLALHAHCDLVDV